MTFESEIYISQTFGETRIGLFERGELAEIHIERYSQLSVVGNIYKGKVLRVLPGMQAAFIDIGLSKNAFLPIKDVRSQNLAGDSGNQHKKIEDLLIEGQMIWVQVNRDPLGEKGARLTTNLSLPSDKLVYFPDDKQISISKKIQSQEQRHRINSLLESFMDENKLSGGFVVRTIAGDLEDQDIINAARALTHAWSVARQSLIHSSNVICVYQHSSILISLLREFNDKSNLRISFDLEDDLHKIGALTSEYYPELAKNIELLSEDRCRALKERIEDGINHALRHEVGLPNGGALNIHSTEALVSIDVNTGANVGGSGSLSLVVENNIEAAIVIAQQIRLRNLGGIIIIDFVDMAQASEREGVIATLKSELAKDRAHTQVSDVTKLGLVEIKRQRTRRNLAEALCEPCEVCQGTGQQKTVETVCYQILREIIDHSRYKQAKAYTILTTESVIEGLRSAVIAKALESLKQTIPCAIHLKQGDFLAQNEYEIALS